MTDLPVRPQGMPSSALPIEELLGPAGDHRVVCEPEPQRWRVYEDGRFVGYITRFASPVNIELAQGARRRADPRRPPVRPRGRRARR